MAGNETIYTFSSPGPVLLGRGRDNTSSVPVYLGADAVLPTVGAYALKDAVGNLVSQPTVSFPGDVATVTVPAADLPDTLYLGEGYSEHWVLTLDGVPRPFRRDVVVSLFELHPPVSEADLVEGEYPTLLDDLSGYTDTLRPFMDSAWRELTRTLVKRGDFTDIIVEPSDVYEWYRQMVLERIFRMLFRAEESTRFETLWTHHKERAMAERDGCRFKSDRARRGLADSLAREPASRSVHTNLPPRRRTYNPKW